MHRITLKYSKNSKIKSCTPLEFSFYVLLSSFLALLRIKINVLMLASFTFNNCFLNILNKEVFVLHLLIGWLNIASLF